MLKFFMPTFGPDVSICLKDITEKHVPEKLKPMVGSYTSGASALPSLLSSLHAAYWVRTFQTTNASQMQSRSSRMMRPTTC